MSFVAASMKVGSVQHPKTRVEAQEEVIQHSKNLAVNVLCDVANSQANTYAGCVGGSFYSHGFKGVACKVFDGLALCNCDGQQAKKSLVVTGHCQGVLSSNNDHANKIKVYFIGHKKTAILSSVYQVLNKGANFYGYSHR